MNKTQEYSVDQATWIEVEDSTLDRGLQFGDGLFETIRLSSTGQAPLLKYHKARLLSGLNQLNFSTSSQTVILKALSQILAQTQGYTGLKLVVSRGKSVRGYQAPENIYPSIYALFFQSPELSQPSENPDTGLSVGVNSVRLARQPLLAGIKHLNRLEQVLARANFKPSWSESLMLDTQGLVIEAVMSNVFVKISSQWVTPKLEFSGVSGTARSWLLDQEDIEVRDIGPTELAECEAMVLSNSMKGFQWVNICDERSMLYDDRVASWQSSYIKLFL